MMLLRVRQQPISQVSARIERPPNVVCPLQTPLSADVVVRQGVRHDQGVWYRIRTA
jgi:hypothetical protein